MTTLPGSPPAGGPELGTDTMDLLRFATIGSVDDGKSSSPVSTRGQVLAVEDGGEPTLGPHGGLVGQMEHGCVGHGQWRMKTGWRSVPS